MAAALRVQFGSGWTTSILTALACVQQYVMNSPTAGKESMTETVLVRSA